MEPSKKKIISNNHNLDKIQMITNNHDLDKFNGDTKVGNGWWEYMYTVSAGSDLIHPIVEYSGDTIRWR